MEKSEIITLVNMMIDYCMLEINKCIFIMSILIGLLKGEAEEDD